MDQLAFFRLQKIDVERRLVYGRAVQEVSDRVGEIFDYESSKPLFQEWSASQSEASMGKSAGNIRAMHKDVSAGIVVPGGITFQDDEKAIDIVTHIVDDDSWKKVEAGVFTGFSIGGSYVKKWKNPDGEGTRYTASPSEISLVDRPCGPTSTFFEVRKADGSVEKREFAKPEGDKAAVDAGLELARQQLAKANGDGTIAGFDRNKAISELLMKGQTMAIADLSDVELNKLWKGEAAAPAAEPVAEPVKVEEPAKPAAEVTKTDPPVFDRKAAVDYLLTKGQKIEDLAALDNDDLSKMQDDAKEGEKPVDSVEVKGSDEEVLIFAKMMNEAKLTMSDVIKMVAKVAARKDADPKEGKAKYGSVAFADEKNKKYPIDTEDHIRAAWNYINKDKNASKYSDEDAKAIKAKIVAAWKKTIDKDGPPSASEESKKSVTAGELRKGLYTCSVFAQLLESLCGIAQSVEYEASYEGDDSDIPARLNDAIKELGAIFVDMVAEEVAEATDDSEDDDAMMPVLAMSQAAKDLIKRAESFEKAGARNSKADADRIQKMHDHSTELGAVCKAAEKIVKADTVDGALAKQLSDSNDALQKALSTANESITKLAADVAMLKAQPMPSTVRLMAVAKGMEIGDEQQDKPVEPVRKQDGTIDEVATAMKKVQQTGGRPLIGG